MNHILPVVFVGNLLKLGVALAFIMAMQVGLSASVQAQNQMVDLVSLYQKDLRALAMGNGFGPIAQGDTAMLYNPAGMALEGPFIDLEYSTVLEGEEGSFFSDTYSLLSGNPTPADFTTYLSNFLGTSQYYRTQTFTNALFKIGLMDIGVGILTHGQDNMEFLDIGSTPGSIDLVATEDEFLLESVDLSITFFSFGFEMYDGKVLVGLNYKDFEYSETSNQVPFSTIVSGGIDLSTAGKTYEDSGFDLGIIYRLEAFSSLRGRMSFTAYNIGGIVMTSTDSTTVREVPATYNFGLALEPKLTLTGTHLLVSIEAEDITGAYEVYDDADLLFHDRGIVQRLHYGLEFGFWQLADGNNMINTRLGVHRGYISYGYELNLFAIRLVYTNYGDNFGHEDAKDPHDFDSYQLSLGFGF